MQHRQQLEHKFQVGALFTRLHFCQTFLTMFLHLLPPSLGVTRSTDSGGSGPAAGAAGTGSDQAQGKARVLCERELGGETEATGKGWRGWR